MPSELYSAIIGASIGAWITYRLALELVKTQVAESIRLAEIQRRHEAGVKFRLAFYDELAVLSEWNNKDINIPALLEKAFQKHLAAALEFANFLCIDDRDKFISKWQEYYQDESGSNNSMYYHDFLKYSTIGEVSNKANRELAINRLEHLLSYAKA